MRVGRGALGFRMIRRRTRRVWRSGRVRLARARIDRSGAEPDVSSGCEYPIMTLGGRQVLLPKPRSGRKKKEVRRCKCKAAAPAVERRVVRQGIAVEACRVPDAVLRVDECVDPLSELGQTGVPEVVRGVKGIPEEIAVEVGVLCSKVVEPIPVRRLTDLGIRTLLEQARRLSHEDPVGSVQVLQGVVVEVLEKVVDVILRVCAGRSRTIGAIGRRGSLRDGRCIGHCLLR